jgi:hypothetical protein
MKVPIASYVAPMSQESDFDRVTPGSRGDIAYMLAQRDSWPAHVTAMGKARVLIAAHAVRTGICDDVVTMFCKRMAAIPPEGPRPPGGTAGGALGRVRAAAGRQGGEE